jgi:hypothetical protein
MSRAPVALWVGPLQRYFAERPSLGVPRDAAAIREAVLRWRDDLGQKLAARRVRLEWDEDDPSLARFSMAATALPALRLLAVYADRSDLELPVRMPPELSADTVYQKAAAADFHKSRFAQVLVPDAWLPADFDLTIEFPYPDGLDAVLGSAFALHDQLVELNRVLFQAEAETLAQWRREAMAEGDDPLLLGRAGLSVLSAACADAIGRRQPMLVDAG